MESPRDRERGSGSGISAETLVIASVASAAASFLASRVWGAGTLISAAVTPVVVALVSEFLRRPVERVSEVAKTPAIPRYSASSKPRPFAPRDQESEGRPRDQESEGASAAPAPPNGNDAGSGGDRAESADAGDGPAEGGEIHIYSSRRRWRLALITGLAAFAIVVVVYTVTDVLTGQSIAGGGGQTTFFGGSPSSSSSTTTSSTSPSTTTTVTKTTTTATSPKQSSTSTSTSTSSGTSPTVSSSSSASSTSSHNAPAAQASSTSTAAGP